MPEARRVEVEAILQAFAASSIHGSAPSGSTVFDHAAVRADFHEQVERAFVGIAAHAPERNGRLDRRLAVL